MRSLQREIRFTELHQSLASAHPAVREAACQRAQFQGGLIAPQPGDLFCGRFDNPLIGFTPEGTYCADLAYYCCDEKLAQGAERGEFSQRDCAKVPDLRDYWTTRTTACQVRASYPPELAELLPSDRWIHDPGIAFPLYRMAGAYLDYGKLLRLGLKGLSEEVCRRRSRAKPFLQDDPLFFDSLLDVLALLRDLCREYAEICRKDAARLSDQSRREELGEMAQIMDKIAQSPPETFREAAQLYWIWATVAQVTNYGRMDMHLGPFYARDLECGRITPDDGLALTCSLWMLIADRKSRFNGRVVIGGRGRPAPESADQFAMLAMEATRRVIEEEPQLTLRVHEGMNHELMDKALDIIGDGRTYPLLYNDDVNIPQSRRRSVYPPGMPSSMFRLAAANIFWTT